MFNTLTDDQYAVFMTRISEAPIRDRTILLLLLHTGLRNGELCSLRFQDLYAEKEVFHSIEIANGHGNNKRFRLLPLTPILISTLGLYLPAFISLYGSPDPASHVFLTRNQKIPVQQRDVQRIVNKYTRAWLNHAFHPHNLRHTYATRLIRKSNARVAQILLGHVALQSTMIYTHPNSQDCEEAVNQAF